MSVVHFPSETRRKRRSRVRSISVPPLCERVGGRSIFCPLSFVSPVQTRSLVTMLTDFPSPCLLLPSEISTYPNQPTTRGIRFPRSQLAAPAPRAGVCVYSVVGGRERGSHFSIERQRERESARRAMMERGKGEADAANKVIMSAPSRYVECAAPSIKVCARARSLMAVGELGDEGGKRFTTLFSARLTPKLTVWRDATRSRGQSPAFLSDPALRAGAGA